MKMKEVIEKTGLTDRAVRLYIDEGLAIPSIAESYSGRKSIDFSENDVERLKNVALLRKAGFSIADIKSIVDDNSTAKNIVEKFIEQTENNIAHETEIVEKLKGISFDEDVTIETICNSLSATVEEKEVPGEDMYYKETKRFAKGFSISLIVLAVMSFVASMLFLNSEYEHLFFGEDAILLILISFSGIILTVLLAAIILITYTTRSKTERGMKIRNKISDIAALLIWVLFVPSILVCFFGMTMIVPITVYSRTDDPKDYLVLDEVVEAACGEEIYSLFPDEIPAFSENDKPTDVKYFYNCDHGFFYGDTFNIIAEWSLSKKNYENAKRNAPVSIGGKETVTRQKNDWVCVYYADSNEVHLPYQGGYLFVNFAYNDELQKVRYIVSCDYYTYPEEAEIYNSIDWN